MERITDIIMNMGWIEYCLWVVVYIWLNIEGGKLLYKLSEMIKDMRNQ